MEPDIENDLVLLRSLMARELETINHYRGLAERAPEGDAREFFLHILEEEKLHVADVLRAIAQLDADQAGFLTAGYAAGHTPGQIPGARRGDATPEDGRTAAAPAAAAAPRDAVTPARAGILTVGSLRGVAQ